MLYVVFQDATESEKEGNSNGKFSNEQNDNKVTNTHALTKTNLLVKPL